MTWTPEGGGIIDELAGFLKPGAERWKFEIRVITPIMGAGITKTAEDTISPIRATAIRGQLRFWWRAIYGTRMASLGDMKRAEDRIWGSTNGRGLADVAVVARPTDFKDLSIGTLSRSLQYGAFPARPPVGGGPVTQLHRLEPADATHAEVWISLRNASPDDKQQIMTSVQAWLLLGGVGGRTRRGFGAIQMVSAEPEGAAVATLNKLLKNVPEAAPRLLGCPSILQSPKRTWTNAARVNGERALEDGLSKLKDFRSGMRAKHDNDEFGISRWPEADAIRTIRGRPLKRGAWGTHIGEYLRAAFGLPIQFAFPKKKGRNGRPDTPSEGPVEELLPVSADRVVHNRWPSPLLIRPLCQTDGKFKCLALLLEVNPPSGLAFKGGPGPLDWNPGDQIAPGTNDDDPLLVDGSHETNTLGAFTKFFSKP